MVPRVLLVSAVMSALGLVSGQSGCGATPEEGLAGSSIAIAVTALSLPGVADVGYGVYVQKRAG